MADVLIQSRVPEAVARWLTGAAKSNGLSVAGWLRTYLLQEYQRMIVQAWLQPVTHSDPSVFLMQGYTPHYHLRQLATTAVGDRVFSVHHGAGKHEGLAISAAVWKEHPAFQSPMKYRVLLEGSPHRYRLEQAVFNEGRNWLEWTLRVEQPASAEDPLLTWNASIQRDALDLLHLVQSGEDGVVPEKIGSRIDSLLALFDAHVDLDQLPVHANPHVVEYERRVTQRPDKSAAVQILARVHHALKLEAARRTCSTQPKP